MDILNETAPEVPPSLLELETEQKVVGVKLKRALREGRAQRVFLAEDADPHLIAPVVQLCSQCQVPCTWVSTMEDLGRACGIHVGAAAAAVITPGP